MVTHAKSSQLSDATRFAEVLVFLYIELVLSVSVFFSVKQIITSNGLTCNYKPIP